MVRWFAEQASGVVELESTVGIGTTVRLLLPRVEHHVSEPTFDKTMPLSTLPTGTERVIVVADDEELRSTFAKFWKCWVMR